MWGAGHQTKVENLGTRIQPRVRKLFVSGCPPGERPFYQGPGARSQKNKLEFFSDRKFHFVNGKFCSVPYYDYTFRSLKVNRIGFSVLWFENKKPSYDSQRKIFRRRRVHKQPKLADTSDLTVSIHFPRLRRKSGSKHSWTAVNAVSSDLIAVKGIICRT